MCEMNSRSLQSEEKPDQSGKLRDDMDWGAEGERKFAGGSYEEACRCFERALQCRPFDAKMHNNMSVALWQQGNTGDALQHLTQALELDPDDRDVIFNCGRIFCKLGRQEDAREILGAFLDRNPGDGEAKNELERLNTPAQDSQPVDSAAFLNQQGEEQFTRGKKEHARVCFELALEHNPDSARACNNLGVLYWGEGDLKKALEHLYKALDLDAEDAEILYNSAKVLTASGEVETAADFLQLYLQKHPRDEAAWQDYRQLISESTFAWNNNGLAPEVGDIYLHMGQALAAAKDYPGAAEALGRAAMLKPDDAQPLYQLGLLHLELEQKEDAIRMFRAGLERDPEHRGVILALARALIEEGCQEQARPVLEAYLAGHEDQEMASYLEDAGATNEQPQLA